MINSFEDEWDVVVARQRARLLAQQAGFSASDADAVAVAVSEVAHNIVRHAGRGELLQITACIHGCSSLRGSFFLLGPRGTGKTTWLLEHFAALRLARGGPL